MTQLPFIAEIANNHDTFDGTPKETKESRETNFNCRIPRLKIRRLSQSKRVWQLLPPICAIGFVTVIVFFVVIIRSEIASSTTAPSLKSAIRALSTDCLSPSDSNDTFKLTQKNLELAQQLKLTIDRLKRAEYALNAAQQNSARLIDDLKRERSINGELQNQLTLKNTPDLPKTSNSSIRPRCIDANVWLSKSMKNVNTTTILLILFVLGLSFACFCTCICILRFKFL
ncbi:hypothetical protein M3Y98_00829300 [Aphelenchoides besseyi]|nr:hypothetical protein M3Y98_00829300 [Aphelenchoides besseyi]KAI6195403.1 hypothetical protein M3Y96_01227600 [Aphelenchoides besseyi]